MTLALSGVRILDLTDAISGPFSTMLLANCGAEVIRIESLRHLGFREGPLGPTGNDEVHKGLQNGLTFSDIDMELLMTPNFSRYNLDKMSVALNLTKPEARDILKKLVKQSDVVVDNLSFSVMHNWGFDYESLRELKSDIIVVKIPSLGRGPHENWTTWGMNLLSFTGFAHGWGHPDTPMEERAANNTYGDYIAGMKAASSILAALYNRSNTGQGQYIEVAQAEATASLLGPYFMDYFVNDRISPPQGNRHPNFSPYNCFPCKGEDRWCVIAVSSDEGWEQFCGAIGSPKWAKDDKFGTMESRLKNNDELEDNIKAWTKTLTPHQVMKILQTAGVPAGAVQNSEDLYYDHHLRNRGHMFTLDHGAQGNIVFDGPPVKLAKGQKPQPESAPRLGEQNDYVYKELLGFSQEEITQLIKDKIIF